MNTETTADGSPSGDPGLVAGTPVVARLDGTVVDRSAPLLRADDLGVLRGDGVFEAMLVADGQPWFLEEHLARLERSAAMLELQSPPAETWWRCIRAAMAASGDGEMYVRLVLTRGPENGGPPTGYVLADAVDSAKLRARAEGVDALTLVRGLQLDLWKRAPWLLLGAKTLSYAVHMAANRWAQSHGADDAIFVTDDGLVLETPSAAVLAVKDGHLMSPPPSLGILASITLEGLFAAGAGSGWDTSFERLTIDDLHRADGVWLVSSVRLIARVRRLDGKPLAVSPVLNEQMAELVKALQQIATRPTDGRRWIPSARGI
jgi:4-amino-4-deoxychorismate lyase